MFNLVVPLAGAICVGPHCGTPCVGSKCLSHNLQRVPMGGGVSPILGSAVSEPLRSCTDGFMYDSEKDCCFRDIVAEPMFSCHQAGGVLEGDRCRCQRTKVISCMEGFRYNPMNDTCEKANLVPMIPSCSHIDRAEMTDDGKNCISEKEIPARARCPKGTKLLNNVCVTYVPVPDGVIFTCPDGWLNIGNGLCEMQEELTCEDVDVEKCTHKSCGFQKFKPCKSPCKVLKKNRRNLSLCDKSLGNCEKPLDAEVVCQAADCMMEYGAVYVQEKQVSVKTTCTRTTHMSARRECLRGKLNRKGECCMPEYMEPVLDCGPGSELRNGQCVKRVHTITDFLCPAGFTVDCGKKRLKKAHPSKCECVSRESVLSLRQCPAGTYPTPDGMCEMFTPADIYCPDEGFQLSPDGVCVGREHEPVRLEYTVTYVKQKECQLDFCEEKATKSTIRHKSIFKQHGLNMTDCDLNPCVNIRGDLIDGRYRGLAQNQKVTEVAK